MEKKCPYCQWIDSIYFDETYYGADINQCTCDELVQDREINKEKTS